MIHETINRLKFGKLHNTGAQDLDSYRVGKGRKQENRGNTQSAILNAAGLTFASHVQNVSPQDIVVLHLDPEKIAEPYLGNVVGDVLVVVKTGAFDLGGTRLAVRVGLGVS